MSEANKRLAGKASAVNLPLFHPSVANKISLETALEYVNIADEASKSGDKKAVREFMAETLCFAIMALGHGDMLNVCVTDTGKVFAALNFPNEQGKN